MELDLKDRGITKALYLYGTREGDQVSIALDVLKDGMRVLDIGANMGYYVLLEAAIVGEKGKVYGFEPHPNNFTILKRNIELNDFSKRVELHQKGVSDKEGEMEFFVSPKSNLHTLNPVRSKDLSKKQSFDGSMKIDVVDIVSFLKRTKEIDFIRMDIEGHEVEVLEALYKGLDALEVFPSILFETHFPKYSDDHNMRKALLNLFGKGYNVESIVSDKEERSPLKRWNYKPERIIKTDQVRRGIYHNVENNHALQCICDDGGIRAILLKKG